VINGIILLNKYKFVTSNKILTLFKRKLKLKKAGLLGILDPLATGALPIVIGEATKYITYIENNKKSYDIKCKLGVFSECGDFESEPTEYNDEKSTIKNLQEQTIIETLTSFIGEYMQVPPMFSSTKHNGKPLYTYARQNIEIERAPKKRQIYEINFISLKSDILEFSVVCSSGTYIRTLVQDISKKWGLHSCLYSLHRSKVEPFEDFKNVTLENLSVENFNEYLITIPDMLSKLPKLLCSKEEINKLYNGLFIEKNICTTLHSLHRITSEDNTFHGIGFFKENCLYPKRLMKR
jgi:tRNA pseudouridine55 synthase